METKTSKGFDSAEKLSQIKPAKRKKWDSLPSNPANSRIHKKQKVEFNSMIHSLVFKFQILEIGFWSFSGKQTSLEFDSDSEINKAIHMNPVDETRITK